ncbi:MAG: hypothetical protein K2X77_11285, partial [Candidatus Obscuribacterales bacterium]|nr:hypothetical protein [Candidatus Obscuribacterales bacterium]
SNPTEKRESLLKIEAGKMPALPGSNPTEKRESLLKIEAGKMPALPGSNHAFAATAVITFPAPL